MFSKTFNLRWEPESVPIEMGKHDKKHFWRKTYLDFNKQQAPRSFDVKFKQHSEVVDERLPHK